MALELQRDIIIWLQGFSNTLTDWFFNFVSFFGEPEFYILLLGLIYWTISKRAGEFLGITLGLSISINNILKGIFMVERPHITYPDEINNMRASTATGSAFPSGHAQGANTIFFGIAAYFKRRGFWIFAWILMVLMMLSRMFLGVHYLQDVVVGSIIGLAIALLMHRAFTKLHETPEKLHQFYLALIIVMFPAILLIDVNDFFRGYGIMVGFFIAILIEKKKVNFSVNVPIINLAIRYVVGVLFMLLTMIALGELFDLIGFEAASFGANMLDFVRFFAVALTGFGIYPMLFKKLNF